MKKEGKMVLPSIDEETFEALTMKMIKKKKKKKKMRDRERNQRDRKNKLLKKLDLIPFVLKI